MAATARRLERRFGLPDFAMGIDGMLCRFEEAPRGIPVGPGYPVKQSFWSRKMFYGKNVLIVGNDKRIIYALDADWPGSAHDSGIWNSSLFKPLIEQQRRFLVAADSAFPISDVVIKPYSQADAAVDAQKARFNTRLSGRGLYYTFYTLFVGWCGGGGMSPKAWGGVGGVKTVPVL